MKGKLVSKTFTLDVVLTVTTGILLTTIDELYRILDHLTGDQLFTHQLPRAAEFAKPLLFEKYPELETIQIPQLSSQEEVDDFLDMLKEDGIAAEYELDQLEGFTHKNSIDELIEMRGSADGIILVKLE